VTEWLLPNSIHFSSASEFALSSINRISLWAGLCKFFGHILSSDDFADRSVVHCLDSLNDIVIESKIEMLYTVSDLRL
jgi:hypothetical protein